MNKNDELICLKIAEKAGVLKEYKTTFVQNERPDFIGANNKVGIEHFLIDTLEFSKKKGSIIKKQNRQIEEKIKYYKENPEELDKDIKNGKAPDFISSIPNERLNKIRDFKCKTFIKNFIRIYSEHYSKIDEYKKESNIDKIIFLIEVRYSERNFNKHGFVIERNGEKWNQAVKGIPIPNKIINLFKISNKLDCIILCFIPYEIIIKKHKKCKVVKIKKENFKNPSALKGIVVCDSFDYSFKFTSDTPIKIEVKNEQGEN